ncbi:MAG: P-II family nitrogen regulator [Xanthomonadales bacterium]|nr:P-II family nitrogen regulator [Xanthomonadales bacterium]
MSDNIREVKAFIHRNRIADVVGALYQAGYRDLTVIDVQGLLKALDTKEQRYSVEIGQKVITEVKLELVCEGEQRTAKAVELIREHARTGQDHAGWIYVTGLIERTEIV